MFPKLPYVLLGKEESVTASDKHKAGKKPTDIPSEGGFVYVDLSLHCLVVTGAGRGAYG